MKKKYEILFKKKKYEKKINFNQRTTFMAKFCWPYVCVRVSSKLIFEFNFLLWVFQTLLFLGICWLLFTIILLNFFSSIHLYTCIFISNQMFNFNFRNWNSNIFKRNNQNWRWWFGVFERFLSPRRSLIGMAKIMRRRKQIIECFFVLEWTEFRRHCKDALLKGTKERIKKTNLFN